MGGEKVRVPDLIRMKRRGEKIVCLTAYDFSMARILDECGVDVLLIGDSAGVVVAGNPDTLPVTMEEMIYHTKAVVRGRRRALVVVDMPFMSYQVSPHQAVENAGRLIKEGGAEAVKLEGGVAMQQTIAAIVAVDIPVMAHIGLTPQSVHRMGGYQVQGRSRSDSERLISAAFAVQEAGAFSVVLEGMPAALGQEITQKLTIPTIGIGAGVQCDGQVLVVNDMLGLFDEFVPRFVKRYADLKKVVSEAVRRYSDEVRRGEFPDDAHSFHVKPRGNDA